MPGRTKPNQRVCSLVVLSEIRSHHGEIESLSMFYVGFMYL